MGKNIIIKGADFSQNAIVQTKEERLVDIFNGRIVNKGMLGVATTYAHESTNIKGVSYVTAYEGDKKICIGGGGILLSEFLGVLNITKITFAPLNGYRYNIAVGNSSTSVICNGSWNHMTSALTVDFTDFHDVDWTEISNCYFILCIVQKTTDTTEVLDNDFSKYMSFSCE